MIPEAAVEAAAKILYERDGFLDALDAAPTHRRHRYLDEAERLLEAAAPHMRFELQCMSLIDEME